MTRATLFFTVLLFLAGAGSGGPARALSPADLERLTGAGIGADTLAVIVQERALETAQVTVDGLIAMKAAGLSEEVIRQLVRRGSFVRDRSPRRYGDPFAGRRPPAAELIALKRAGVPDDVLAALVADPAAAADRAARRRAWRMLENLGIVLDPRAPGPGPGGREKRSSPPPHGR